MFSVLVSFEVCGKSGNEEFLIWKSCKEDSSCEKWLGLVKVSRKMVLYNIWSRKRMEIDVLGVEWEE